MSEDQINWPFMCPWQCHIIGGPWISENPDCPYHGASPEDLDELDQSDVDRMCQEEEARRDDE